VPDAGTLRSHVHVLRWRHYRRSERGGESLSQPRVASRVLKISPAVAGIALNRSKCEISTGAAPSRAPMLPLPS